MMNDFEKNRAENIQFLERQIVALRQEVNALKPLATKWTPTVSSEMDPSGQSTNLTMHFGGKCGGATISADTLLSMSETDLTTAVIDTLADAFIKDQFRALISAEIKKIQNTTKVLSGAGKW